MRARRQGLSFQVAGGGLGWQVAGGELGRAAIAIAAARDRRWGVVGSWLGSKTSYLRPRTDVMAITSLPKGHYVVTRSRPYLRTLRKASRREVSGLPVGVQVGQSQPPSSCSFQA